MLSKLLCKHVNASANTVCECTLNHIIIKATANINILQILGSPTIIKDFLLRPTDACTVEPVLKSPVLRDHSFRTLKVHFSLWFACVKRPPVLRDCRFWGPFCSLLRQVWVYSTVHVLRHCYHSNKSPDGMTSPWLISIVLHLHLLFCCVVPFLSHKPKSVTWLPQRCAVSLVGKIRKSH